MSIGPGNITVLLSMDLVQLHPETAIKTGVEEASEAASRPSSGTELEAVNNP